MFYDSSVLLECLFSQSLKTKCLASIQKHNKSKTISSLSYFECYKVIAKKAGSELALEAMAFLESFEVVDINKEISLTAADLALAHNLSMADSLVLASALSCKLQFVTLDNDFSGIADVTIIR